jgi:nucleoside-diphosphate-sugar epimerase
MDVLVTGAAGFVGGRLCAKLITEGHKVTGVDNFSDYYNPELKMQTANQLRSAGVTLIDGDLNELDLSTLVDTEVIYHQAGQPGVRNSWGSDFAPYIVANISATQKLLEAVLENNRETKLVYASSSSIYGSAETYPTTEKIAPKPKSPYGVTKLAAEHLCSLYAENYGLNTVSLRYFTVYGPRQRPDMAFNKFSKAILSGEKIKVFGDGNQIRDFTYIDDIVQANIDAGSKSFSPGSVYNVSGGGQHSVLEIIDKLSELSGSALEYEIYPEIKGDVSRTCGENAEFRAAFDWHPLTSISEGLKAELEWMDNLLITGNQDVFHA